jgi:hypothetical protein
MAERALATAAATGCLPLRWGGSAAALKSVAGHVGTACTAEPAVVGPASTIRAPTPLNSAPGFNSTKGGAFARFITKLIEIS